MTEALNCVAENAKRLLTDAESLLGLEKWQSATALAILAIEEVGKYYLIRWKNKERENFVSHKSKQSVLASFYMAEVSVSAITKYINDKGFESKHVSELTEWQKKFLETESGRQMSDWLLSADNEELVTTVATAMMEHKFADLGRQVRTGEIDKIKQKALYVDVDANGEVLSDPSSITSEIAEEWVAHARFAVGSLRRQIE